MKLLLASAGFFTPAIVDTCTELVGKPRAEINIAVINEAYAVEHGDHTWVLNELNQLKHYFSGRMEFVNLLALDNEKMKERLQLADVFFVVGGSTDYLMSIFRKTGFAELLPELLKTKVYVGSSAGSMVLGRRISTEAYAKIYGEEKDYGVTEYMNLVDFALKPHLGNKLFPRNNKDMLFRGCENYKGIVYGLADDSAVIVEDDKVYFVGSDPVKIVDGELVAE